MIPYRSVLIVGGGTAGWLAAAYLQRTLGANPETPISITLVDSADIGAIGVGEATVPTLRQTMGVLDIPESSLFAHADATLKNGVRFVGWRRGDGSDEDRYDHPFESPAPMEGYSTMVHWLNLMQRGATDRPFAEVGVVQTALFDDCLSPKLMHSQPFDAPVPYAYHIDANRLTKVLREVSLSRGVQHIQGTVVSVNQNEGGIESVQLADGSVHRADLFVDCSGFSSLLIGETLKVPWVSYADSLLCDRAVAVGVAHASESVPLRSYTTATAQSAGWIWDIDLQSRRGTGYVYSSAFCSEEDAQARLLSHNQGRQPLAEPRHLKMRVGHWARVWEKNCLSLGLASGFIEPLESTSIYLIEHALQMFLDYLPAAVGSSQSQQKYNSLMSELFDEIRDFILLHYVLSQREDSPFWRTYRNEIKLTPSLLSLMVLWDEKVPGGLDINRRISLWGPQNWFYILAGMQRLPSLGTGQAPFIAEATSRKVLDQIAQIRKSARTQSPTMRDYAQKVRSAVANMPIQQPAVR